MVFRILTSFIVPGADGRVAVALMRTLAREPKSRPEPHHCFIRQAPPANFY